MKDETLKKEVLERCVEVQMQACQDCRRRSSLWSGRRGIKKFQLTGSFLVTYTGQELHAKKS